MAIDVSKLVWQTPLDPGPKLLLLALADFASPDGTEVHPATARLVRMNGLSKRWIKKIRGDFIKMDLPIANGNVSLVVFDPLVAFLSDKTETHRDHETRRALRPPTAITQRTETSVPSVSSPSAASLARTCTPCSMGCRAGWWAGTIPRSFTHCGGCHVTFPASQRWGHCARCHETFSGVESFDLHQRVDRESGDFTPDCLCTVAASCPNQESLLGVPSQRRWDVSGKTLVRKQAEWGRYWGQDVPHLFGGGP